MRTLDQILQAPDLVTAMAVDMGYQENGTHCMPTRQMASAQMPVEQAQSEQALRYATRCSPYLKRLLYSDAALLPEFLEHLQQAWTEQAMRDYLDTHAVHSEADLKKWLRKLRQRVMLRLITRDLNGLADLQEVMQVTSHLAEVSLQFALQHITPWLEALHGVPYNSNGDRQQLIVVGMGKLGGSELNVSSDIDLIFAFEEDGETAADNASDQAHAGAAVKSLSNRTLSNHEFFTRVAKKLIAAIDDITEDGFVFRVDMRLRPYGSDGPLACSFAMMEEYYQNQGREWERYAWIKGRVVAGPGHNLANLLRPFVFRKYLDFGAFTSMRELKVQIQRDVNRRLSDKDQLHDNIKLGRGGIREVEFIAQVFQLIRGGQDSSLQIRPTLRVLQLLKQRQLLPALIVDQLSEAYVFLRNLEHRLQYVEDAQTQTLPVNVEAQARIALSMHYAHWDLLKLELDVHRSRVELYFQEVFSDATPGTENITITDLWKTISGNNSGNKLAGIGGAGQANSEQASPAQASLAQAKVVASLLDSDAIASLQALGFQQAQETLRRLRAVGESGRYRQLPALSRQRFDVLMPLVIALAAAETTPDTTLIRVSDLLESICRRASYLALLAEYPAALGLIIKLASASPWLMQYLSQHPVLLDELLDTEHLYAAPDFPAMQLELGRRLKEVEGDVERQMDVMRHFKHAAVFRFAARDVMGELPLQTLSDYLSALANLVLQATLDIVWPSLRGKHRDQPKFAVIGYGKLGGKELGYASDLDIIFLYDDDAAEAGEIYARFGQRINNWLNSLTSAGMLYETDLQLRPDGASGLLVSSVTAFQDYQLNKAWMWEHQALTRAAYSAGDKAIGSAFDAIRSQVLTQPRDKAKLREQVVAMRQKMRDSNKPVAGWFDLKQDVGGIIDVEFMVQYLVLANAAAHPELISNIGNIALLKLLAGLTILDAVQAEAVADAYHDYRSLQHASRLQGEMKARVTVERVEQQKQAVIALWQHVFTIQ